MNDLPIVSLGAGGHARVLQCELLDLGLSLFGYISADSESTSLLNTKFLGVDSFLLESPDRSFALINGIGSVGDTSKRRKTFEMYSSAGYEILRVLSRYSRISNSATLGVGAQVMSGAIVGVDALICDNSLINTGAIIEHGCTVGKHSHVSSGAVLAGGVQIGENTHIGANSTVKQGVVIGSNCIIGAGSVVLADIPNGSIAIGAPANWREREIK